MTIPKHWSPYSLLMFKNVIDALTLKGYYASYLATQPLSGETNLFITLNCSTLPMPSFHLKREAAYVPSLSFADLAKQICLLMI